jgi:hypothetical protein
MATQPTETGGNLLNGQTLLDGFGFLVGQLIGGAPMVFPGEQDLFMILELAAEFGGAFGPIGQLVALIAEIIILVLQVIDYLVSLFEGVPRAQKTGIVAHRFATGQSPVSQLVSAQIYQLLNYEGKVLSSSIPADQTTFGEIRHQAEVMLQALGATESEATKWIDNVWNQTTSGTEPLPGMLNQPLPQGWVLVGNKIIQQMYIDHYNQLISQGADPKTAAKKTTQYVLHHAPQAQLLKVRLVPQPGYNPCGAGESFNPQTGKCEPSNPIIHVCPPGMVWDDTQQKCVASPTNPQQCPPGQIWDPTTQMCIVDPNYPQPCVPVNDGQGDTLSDGLGCVSQNLNLIQRQIADLQQAITGTGGQQLDPVTCTQLGGYVSTLNVSLQAISTAIAAAVSGGTPVDLTAVVAQLTAIATALAGLTGAGATPVNVNLTSSTPLATATATAPPTDVSGIIAQLAKLFTTIDVPLPIIQQLVAEGFLPPDALTTVGQGDFGSTIATLWTKWGLWAAQKYLGLFGISVDSAGTHFAGVEATIEKDLGGLFNLLVSGSEVTLTPIVQKLIEQLKPVLTGAPGSPLGGVSVNADNAVAIALGGALSAATAGWIMSFLGIDAGEPLARIGELMGTAIGFEELRDVQIGPLIRQGAALQAERNAKAYFKQELPDTASLALWAFMGLISSDRAKALSAFNGTPDEMYPVKAASVLRGFNARQMLRLIETNLFSSADIADELTFSAMRPVSQHRMLLAAPYLATAAERSSLRSTIESAAVAGLLADADVTSQLDAAESNTDRDSLCLAKVHLQQLVANAKALEAEYSALFKVGLMTDDAFRGALAAIGLQQWAIDMVAAKAEVAANVALQKKTLAAEAALERATENKARTAAVKAFTTGTIDAAALSAALLATGLTAAQAAFWVTQAVLQKGGALRWLYGLQLSPTEATLLRERVTALTDQRKRLQITDPQFVAALQELGIGPRYINALRAAADAMITPKTSAVVIPVQTN